MKTANLKSHTTLEMSWNIYFQAFTVRTWRKRLSNLNTFLLPIYTGEYIPYLRKQQLAHGGRDPGAVYQGRQEKDDTLRLTLAIGEILQNNGIDVEYTRTTDIYESTLQKAQEANAAGVDFFVSIHRNSFPTDNVVSGVESLVYDLSLIHISEPTRH